MAVFKEVYQEYGKPVYRFLLALTRDADLADELLQETFYQALLHIDSFEGRCSLFTWLCQIGKNAWIKECKRRKRFERWEEKEETWTNQGLSLEERVIEADTCDRIRQAVYHLEEPYQNVFVLRVFAEQKYAEIGKMYGKSDNWARITFFRAKAKVLEEIER